MGRQCVVAPRCWFLEGGEAVAVDRAGRVGLHYAAVEDDVDGVRRQLACGVDPNVTDAQGFTPLHFAAQQNAVSAARELIAAGADVNARNTWGNGPLFVAVVNSKGQGEMIRLLRAHGADPLAENKSGQTAVGRARLIANYDIAQYFADLPS